MGSEYASLSCGSDPERAADEVPNSRNCKAASVEGEDMEGGSEELLQSWTCSTSSRMPHFVWVKLPSHNNGGNRPVSRWQARWDITCKLDNYFAWLSSILPESSAWWNVPYWDPLMEYLFGHLLYFIHTNTNVIRPVRIIIISNMNHPISSDILSYARNVDWSMIATPTQPLTSLRNTGTVYTRYVANLTPTGATGRFPANSIYQLTSLVHNNSYMFSTIFVCSFWVNLVVDRIHTRGTTYDVQ